MIFEFEAGPVPKGQKPASLSKAIGEKLYLPLLSEPQKFLRSLPSKYIPSHDVIGVFLGYNSTQVVVARGTVKTNGEIVLDEANWTNGTKIRVGITYCVD